MVPLFDAAFADLGLQQIVLNPLANGKIKDFSRPLSVFQVLFNLVTR